MSVAQISNGKLSLGGIFDGLKIDVDKYKETIEKFKNIDLSLKEFKNTENMTTNWDAIANSIEGCDKYALSYFKTLDNGNGTINNQSASVEGLSKHLKATGQSFNFAAIKATLLNTALNAGIMLAVSFGFQAIINGIDNFINRAEYAKEAMEEAQSAIDNAQNTLKTTSDTLLNNRDRFLELSQGVDKFSKNLHLSEEDYAEYLSISNQLADIFPSLVSGYDEQGNALLSIGENADETNEKLQSLLETEQTIAQQTLIDNMGDIAKGIYYEVEEAKRSITKMNGELHILQDQYKNSNIDIVNSNGFFNFNDSDYSKYGKAMEKALNDAGIEFKNTFELAGTNIVLTKFSPQQLKQAQESYDAWLYAENEYYYASENGLRQDIEKKENLIRASYSKITANLQAWIKSNYNYQYLSENASAMADIVDALVPEIKWDELEEAPSTEYDYQHYIEENIIKPLMEIPQENKQKINNMFEKLLSFEDGDLNVLSFAEELQTELDKMGINIDITPIISNEKEAMDKLESSIENISKDSKSDFTTSSGIKVYKDDYKRLQEYTKDFTADQVELWTKSTLGSKNATDAINKYEEALNSISGYDTFSNLLSSKDLTSVKDNLLDLATAGELTPEVLSSTEEYANLLEKLGLTAEDGANSLKRFFGELDYSNMMDKLEDSISDVIKAQYELSENGKLSFDTTKNLLSVYPELIDQLDATEGGYIINNEALQDLIDTKLENYKLDNNEFIDSANNIISSLGGEAIAYGLTTKEIKEQIQAQIALIKTKLLQFDNTSNDYKESGKNKSFADFREIYNYSKQMSELQNILDSIDANNKNAENAQEIYEKLKESIGKSYSKSSSTSDTTDYWKQEFDEQLSLLKHQLAMNQITAAKYYNELDKLNNKYFANNTKYLSEYRQYEEEVYNGLISLQDNALNSIHKLIDLREDMISDMKQKEIDAIEDIIKAEKDKLDAINESINARKKAIELLRDEKDHEKEMSEKNKTISDLQIKLEALKYDNSASAQKKRRELEEELAKARTDLADYIADYEYDKALEALDNEAELAEKQYEQQEENLQNQIDSIEAYLDDEKQLMQDAINDINGMNNSLFEDMKNWAYETTGEVWEVVEAWKEAKEALEMYNAVNKVPEIHETLHNNSQNGVATAIGATSSIGGKTISNSTSSANSNSQTDSNNSSGYKAVHTIVKNDTLWTLAQKYYGDGTKWTKIQKANSDVDPYKLQIGKKLYIPYRKGIKKVPQNQLALTDEAGDELTLHANEKGNLQMLTKGSSVIPADITENLVKWGKVAPDLFMQNLQPFISPMIIHEFTPKEASPTVNIGDININGNIGSLTKSDLNEFRKDIVNDVYDSMQKNRVKSGRY